MPKRAVRKALNDAAWHERMMGAGPQGAVFRQHGVASWPDMQRKCAELMSNWEQWPPAIRQSYAFPNQGDR